MTLILTGPLKIHGSSPSNRGIIFGHKLSRKDAKI